VRAATNQCGEWDITPFSDPLVNAPPTSIGKLVTVATRPRDPELDLGNFRFSFNIKVSIP
jgi:hypothetical protein